MPKGKKICPKCEAEWGARKRECDCGYQFVKQESKPARSTKKHRKPKQNDHPLGEHMLAPGLWVYDMPKGMPRVHCPEPLSKGPIENQEVYEQAAYNGLGDCVLSFIPANKIADPTLRKKWDKAKKALLDVWMYLTDDTCFKTSTKARKPRTEAKTD